jgi:hypothetical protein
MSGKIPAPLYNSVADSAAVRIASGLHWLVDVPDELAALALM